MSMSTPRRPVGPRMLATTSSIGSDSSARSSSRDRSSARWTSTAPNLRTRSSPRSCARSGRGSDPVGLVVECCGLPGSGKSTLVRAVVARLRLAGIPAADVMAPLGPDAPRAARLGRKAGAIAHGLTEPGSGRLVGAVALRSGQADRRDRVARPANLLVVRHAVRSAAPTSGGLGPGSGPPPGVVVGGAARGQGSRARGRRPGPDPAV